VSAAPSRTFVVFGFGSVHDALLGEDALRSEGIAVVTVPSPRELSELCGIALRVLPGDADAAEAALARAGAGVRARAEMTDL
jgi:hypothetical protein